MIVEQGWSRGALAATRALAAAGWHVGVASAEPAGLAGSSRHCHRRHRIRPLHPVDGFVESVAGAVRAGGYDVVFGAGEAEVLALSPARGAIPAVVPYAADDVVQRALDKAALTAVAGTVGVSVPDVLDPETLADETTPAVVKAHRHARPDLPGSPPRIDTTVVVGGTAVRRRVAEIRALGGEPEAQVMHDGTLVAYASVRGTDGVLARCLQRAPRIWPPGAGASCRATTLPAYGPLVADADALLEALGWFGLAELQFLVPADGPPRLIDCNGRFYGSLSLAVAAGANLPAVWAAAAVGAPPPAPVHARAGVRYQWGCADVRRALTERRGGLVRDLAATAAYALGARHSVADLPDPGPALARLRHALHR